MQEIPKRNKHASSFRMTILLAGVLTFLTACECDPPAVQGMEFSESMGRWQVSKFIGQYDHQHRPGHPPHLIGEENISSNSNRRASELLIAIHPVKKDVRVLDKEDDEEEEHWRKVVFEKPTKSQIRAIIDLTQKAAPAIGEVNEEEFCRTRNDCLLGTLKLPYHGNLAGDPPVDQFHMVFVRRVVAENEKKHLCHEGDSRCLQITMFCYPFDETGMECREKLPKDVPALSPRAALHMGSGHAHENDNI